MAATQIPVVDIASLFGLATPARDEIDKAILAAGSDPGFLMISGLPQDIRFDRVIRNDLLRIFEAPADVTERLIRNWDDPARPFVFRGRFGLTEGRPFYYEGMQIGPDVARGPDVVDSADPLTGPTPLPADEDLPGWRSAADRYFRGMDRVGDVMMRSIARGMSVSEKSFASLFAGGMSALQLLRYPVRSDVSRAGVADDELYVWHEGEKREVISEAHADFGFMTLLVQDGIDGLQVRMPDDRWVDIPAVEGCIVVNFGRLLERWTSGRVRATEHRVVSPGRERFSLPFFYEPRVDAEIAPLSFVGAEQFEPFIYGDHVWNSIPRLRRNFGDRPAGKPSGRCVPE